MLENKLDNLKNILKKYESIVVGYSGGVDSTFLLKIATDTLGKKNVLGVTAKSETYPKAEFEESQRIAEKFGFRVKVIESSELEIENFAQNDVNRCYYCKKELFSLLRKIADEEGLRNVADGSNMDDLNDYRPGMKAAKEIGVVSPLKEAGFTKQDIRDLSKKMGLPTWDKPSFACLSSRFPYGTTITKERVSMIDDAENFLRSLGIKQLRVRYHDDIARIEVLPDDFNLFLDKDTSKTIVEKFKKLGFKYITLDLQGYRTGSLNEGMKIK